MELVKDQPLSMKPIKDAAHKIWLAGLGAFAQLEKAGHESQHLFEHLVEEGEQLEQRLREQHSKPTQTMTSPSETKQHPQNTTDTSVSSEPNLRTLITDLTEQITQLTAIVNEMQNSRQSTDKNTPQPSAKRKRHR